MHAFDCITGAHASCITGAVFIVYNSNASFGGETVFANNTAETGGTTEVYTRLKEPQMTTNKTYFRKGMFW